jgi:hypothetical protein
MSKTAVRDLKAELAEITLSPIGGANFEETVAYYGYTAPKNGNPKVKTLQKGDSFYGEYTYSFKDNTYEKTTYKIRTEDGLIGINGCAALDKLMQRVTIGQLVRITYNGKTPIKSGKYAGKLAHSFFVAAGNKD